MSKSRPAEPNVETLLRSIDRDAGDALLSAFLSGDMTEALALVKQKNATRSALASAAGSGLPETIHRKLFR
jgi:hypothetical protein